MLPGVTVTCKHIRLLHPSTSTSHSGVWGVVAAAAMHSGRKNLIRLHLRREELIGAGQTVITAFFPILTGTPPPTVMQRATRWASAWFWCLLQDFACIHSGVPPGLGTGPLADHPFLAVDTNYYNFGQWPKLQNDDLRRIMILLSSNYCENEEGPCQEVLERRLQEQRK